jgi:hypothetical protein
MPGVSGVAAVTNARVYYTTRAAAGAPGARHSPRPLNERAGRLRAKLGPIAPRDREAVAGAMTLFESLICTPYAIAVRWAKPHFRPVPTCRSKLKWWARLRFAHDAFLVRHCEEQSDEATHSFLLWCYGLLRGACHRARIRATRWLAMTAPYNASSTALAISAVPLRPPNSIGLMPSA